MARVLGIVGLWILRFWEFYPWPTEPQEDPGSEDESHFHGFGKNRLSTASRFKTSGSRVHNCSV